MKEIEKYENLLETFPRLRTVLCDAIQNEFLDIKRIKSSCKHYEDACNEHPPLKDAQCVIYSPFMKRTDHNYETFIFIDDKGEETCHISGREMELEGMLESMCGLKVSEAYSRSKRSA